MTTAARSRIMRAIRSKDTGPERAVRELSRGLMFRRNVRGLPGTPDLANKSARVAVFVHGCFWHGHGCRGGLPKANRAFWRRKFAMNRERDARAARALRADGWKVVTVWECDVHRRPLRVQAAIRSAFEGRR